MYDSLPITVFKHSIGHFRNTQMAVYQEQCSNTALVTSGTHRWQSTKNTQMTVYQEHTDDSLPRTHRWQSTRHTQMTVYQAHTDDSLPWTHRWQSTRNTQMTVYQEHTDDSLPGTHRWQSTKNTQMTVYQEQWANTALATSGTHRWQSTKNSVQTQINSLSRMIQTRPAVLVAVPSWASLEAWAGPQDTATVRWRLQVCAGWNDDRDPKQKQHRRGSQAVSSATQLKAHRCTQNVNPIQTRVCLLPGMGIKNGKVSWKAEAEAFQQK